MRHRNSIFSWWAFADIRAVASASCRPRIIGVTARLPARRFCRYNACVSSASRFATLDGWRGFGAVVGQDHPGHFGCHGTWEGIMGRVGVQRGMNSPFLLLFLQHLNNARARSDDGLFTYFAHTQHKRRNSAVRRHVCRVYRRDALSGAALNIYTRCVTARTGAFRAGERILDIRHAPALVSGNHGMRLVLPIWTPLLACLATRGALASCWQTSRAPLS